MKFLFVGINTKFIHSNPAVRILREYALAHDPSIPEEDLCILESTINNPIEEILFDICKQKPDVVLLSCYIWNWNVMRQLAREVSLRLPDAAIWAGGPEVSFESERILRENPWLSGIMQGEGEESCLKVIQSYRCGEPLSGILAGGEVQMAELPFIYSEESLSSFQNKILYYESSRGCPFSCSYCLSSVSRHVRIRPWEKVQKELDFFYRVKVKQVKFVDRTFNCAHDHCQRILRWILEHDNGVTNYHFEIAGDLLNEEEVGLLSQMRPGQVQLEIGVQTTNPAVIKEIRRTMDLKKLSANVEQIRKGQNVHQHLDLIAGLPLEDLESFQKSFDDVYAMHPDQLQLGFLKVLKGSYMAEKASDYGIVYMEEAPYEVRSTRWLSAADIVLLKQVEDVLEVYYNTHQFTAVMRILEQHFSSAFDMYRQIADFIRENGYDLHGPARITRYQILLEFAMQLAPEKKDLWEEALTFDFYRREKAKKRPSFAIDRKPYEKQVRQFYEEGVPKRDHIDLFTWSVWEEEVKRLDTPAFVQFDYDHLDPLDHNARIHIIGYLQEENHLL